MSFDVADVHAYYRAALVALSCLERARPTGRRFGPDADARWSAVRGGLTASDSMSSVVQSGMNLDRMRVA